MNDQLTQPPTGSSPTLGRRTLFASGGILALATLAACGSSTTSASTAAAGSAASATPTATTDASATPSSTTSTTTTAASSSNTKLKAGSYRATFSSGSSSSGSGGGPGGGSGTQTLDGAYLVNGIEATIDGGTWKSSTADQNVFLVVNGGSLTIKNATITKTGDSTNDDACNFYGLNAAVLVVGKGSSAMISNCTITTSSNGSNGVFSSSQAKITVSSTIITGASGTSTGAQIMVIEGKNAITLSSCTFAAPNAQGMMIYQSFSGDAADGDATSATSSMTITKSTLITTGSQPMIYVTNTSCTVDITSSTLRHASTSDLLSLKKDRWGTSGSNGGHAAVRFSNCTVTGAMVADSISSATVALTKTTTLSGKKSGSVTVTKDATSTWAS